MSAQTEKLALLQNALGSLLDHSSEFLGLEKGAFSQQQGRLLQAEAELSRRGLGVETLGYGTHRKNGEAEKLVALAHDAEAGDALAFDAAMRYVGSRLFSIPDLPKELSGLAASVLTGRKERPAKRKATAEGMTVRNLAVFALVETCRECGLSAETAYQEVARLLLGRGLFPNNSKTVKRLHLAARKELKRGITVMHVPMLASFPYLPDQLAQAFSDFLDRNLGDAGAGNPPSIDGQDR